jgi:ribonuclease HI
MANTDRPTVAIYTDGGADPNPGPGGWGVILLFEENGATRKQEVKGGEVQTTNNRMELTAALEALKVLKHSYNIELFTDSQYLKNGITEWMASWKKTNFKKGKILNSDLWRLLDNEVSRHTIHWHWVKGHSSNEHNERADVLAAAGRAEALGQPVAEDIWSNAYRVYLSASDGAWAVLLEKDGKQTILSGYEGQRVPQRLYLLAAIKALESLSEKEAAHLFTDSDYLRNGIQGWIKGWKRNGWLTQDGKEVKYREFWERLDQLTQARNLKWSSIEGDLPQLKLLTDALKEAKIAADRS